MLRLRVGYCDVVLVAGHVRRVHGVSKTYGGSSKSLVRRCSVYVGCRFQDVPEHR